MKAQFIAERTLVSAENPNHKVVVRLAEPKLNGKTRDYECIYQISGKDVNLTRSAAGLDAMQALQLAFVMIGAEIGRIEKAFGIHLCFGDLENSGFSSKGSP
jgi:hypothetical protein